MGAQYIGGSCTKYNGPDQTAQIIHSTVLIFLNMTMLLIGLIIMHYFSTMSGLD